MRINQDTDRFRHIVRGKVKQNLQQYVRQGELLARQGSDSVRIPLPEIELPHFALDPQGQGGVSQGDGEVGDPVPGEADPSAPGRKAGQGAGEHGLEVEVSFAELAQALGERLALPAIKPKGGGAISHERTRFTGIHNTGPAALRHFKRTFKQALRRQMMLGSYDPAAPRIVPSREDRRYRSWQVKKTPQTRAVILYMMDVSGSMGDDQKEIVRIESFWLDLWLKSQYRGLETRYLIHDATAKEVDKHTFFHSREAGGTMISAAYRLCSDIIAADYGLGDTNVYAFHFSDGDNWSTDDTQSCMQLLTQRILPYVNAFCYGQVASPYGSGQFIKDLRTAFAGDARVLTSDIADKDAILGSIKELLGSGR